MNPINLNAPLPDDLDARQLIIDLRGGVPGKCDFCGKEKPEHELHPEEAGTMDLYEVHFRNTGLPPLTHLARGQDERKDERTDDKTERQSRAMLPMPK